MVFNATFNNILAISWKKLENTKVEIRAENQKRTDNAMAKGKGQLDKQ
jgi:hypothetical protein